MYVLLDTSTAVCRVWLVDSNGEQHEYTWQADRQMAKGLLAYIIECLARHQVAIQEVAGWGVLRGPGSFTGLRIGIATINTIGDTCHAPIVGVTGDNWQVRALQRLQAGESDKIILPEYGREARITAPRK